MLSEKELNVMRDNGKIHKKIFEEIKKIALVGTSAKDIDDLALKICKEAGVLSAFTGVY